MITNVKHFEFKEILFYQERLEYSRAKTIEQFMADEVAIDWGTNEVWTELANILRATMELVNGWWVDK